MNKEDKKIILWICGAVFAFGLMWRVFDTIQTSLTINRTISTIQTISNNE